MDYFQEQQFELSGSFQGNRSCNAIKICTEGANVAFTFLSSVMKKVSRSKLELTAFGS